MKKFILTLVFAVQATSAFASFEQNARRYISYYDLLASFKTIYGNVATSGLADVYVCTVLAEDDKADLGYNNPLTGEAIVGSPTSNYVRWISSCVHSFNTLMVNQYPMESWLLLSENTKKYFNGSNPQSVSFNSLPEEVRRDIFDFIFLKIYGSDEAFNQYGLKNAVDYRKEVQSFIEGRNLKVREALELITLNYMLRDEFLSY